MRLKVILKLDEEDHTITLEEIGEQIQAQTDKAVMIINEDEIKIISMDKIKPLDHWKIIEEENGHYLVQELPGEKKIKNEEKKDSSDESEDTDSDEEGNTYLVFNKKVFKRLIGKPKKTDEKNKIHLL